MPELGITKTFDLGDGRSVSIETGKLAKQADGSVVVKMGNTMLLATVVSKKEASENVDFLPLTVEYQEKYASTGSFPGGFFKREARASEYEILISRLVDRAIRPLFPSDYHADTQVLITLISGDKDTLPDAMACLAASAALSVSDIPFNGPISEVRIGRINGQFIVNPSITQMTESDVDMIVAASWDNIMMVEGAMKELSETDMIEAIKFAHAAIRIQVTAQKELAALVEKSAAKRVYCHEVNDEDLKNRINTELRDKVLNVARSQNPSKHERHDGFEAIKAAFMETIPEDEREKKKSLVNRYYHDLEKDMIRLFMLTDRKRLDGRDMDQIRPIWGEVDYLPSAHGSAIFTRGETQSLTSVTLGTKLDEQIIDGAVIEGRNRFILHYNFPPFSTGEVKPIRGTGRREVGHGNLAMRALRFVLPSNDINPYTVRIVSDILESNGSSSMATVCAGCMALQDAGVKITKPVSGIAMGLISDSASGKYAILSDILGDEDHIGDMDFKVCGTPDGITACQMDIKVDGLSFDVLAEALEQARKGRMHILGEIAKVINKPREDYKPHVPRIEKLTIPKEFIGAVIGPGGKVIQEIQKETKTVIVIEEVGEFGIIEVVSADKDSIEAAKRRIRQITAVPEVGEIYHGVVKNIQSFGAFVEIMPGKDGLLHISEIEHRRLNDVESVLKVGDEVDVKLIEVDKKTGKLKLSRKALLPKPTQE